MLDCGDDHLRGRATCLCDNRSVTIRPLACGAVAQLGERRVRNAKVEGSIPFRSTNTPFVAEHGRAATTPQKSKETLED